MKRFLYLAMSLAFLAASASAQTTLTAVLTGSQETPNPVNTPGFGYATLVVDSTHTQLAFTITFTRLTTPVTASHIHKAPAGQSAPPLIDFNTGVNLSGNRISGTVTITQAVADDLVVNPHNYYVNIHTSQHPGGEIRGQLATAAGVTTYAGELRGSNEVPPNNSTAVGTYFMSLDPQNNLTYEINVAGLQNPTAAHIHAGAAGVPGPVLIGLAQTAADIRNGRITGTVSIASLTPSQLAAIRANPRDTFYVNVHTTAFPGGELRGQLTIANEYDVPVAGHVTNSLGQTFVTDVRIFNPSYENNVGVLVEFFRSGTGNTTPQASLAFQVKPRGTAILDDIAGANYLNQPTIGALRVSSFSRLVVTSRIYADQRAAGKGTFGQFVPAQPRASHLTHGTMPQLSNNVVDLTTGYRTNVGFFNPNPSTATVRLDVRDQNGTSLGTGLVTLPPLYQQQSGLASYFPFIDLSTRPNLTLTFDSNLPIAAYASVVDNVSGDQIFVPAQEDSGAPQTP